MKIDQSRLKESTANLWRKLWETIVNSYRPDGLVTTLWVWVIGFVLIYNFLIEIYWYAFFEFNLKSYAITFIAVFIVSFIIIWRIWWSILSAIVSVIASLVDFIIWKNH